MSKPISPETAELMWLFNGDEPGMSPAGYCHTIGISNTIIPGRKNNDELWSQFINRMARKHNSIAHGDRK